MHTFLVKEGQIRADAIVRHMRPGIGLGLKFTALSEQDRPKLAALLNRLRGTHQTSTRCSSKFGRDELRPSGGTS